MAMSLKGRQALEEYRKAEELGQLSLPWEGQSPRDLTQAAIRFRLRREETTLMAEDARLEEQYRRFRQWEEDDG